PLLAIADVGLLHHAFDELPRHRHTARYPPTRNAEPIRVFNGTLIGLRHADRKGRHVIHEEIGEVFRRHDDEYVGTGRLQGSFHPRVPGYQARIPCRVRMLGASRNARSMAADPDENEAHRASSTASATSPT